MFSTGTIISEDYFGENENQLKLTSANELTGRCGITDHQTNVVENLTSCAQSGGTKKMTKETTEL